MPVGFDDAKPFRFPAIAALAKRFTTNDVDHGPMVSSERGVVVEVQVRH